MEQLRSFLLSVLAVSFFCAMADTLMPEGGPKRVGRLLCGLVLLCTFLSGLLHLDLREAREWMEEQERIFEEQNLALQEQAGDAVFPVIEAQYEAYILDRAAELGLPPIEVEVTCRADEEGLPLPEQVLIRGDLFLTHQQALSRAIREELGVDCVYRSGEEGMTS